MSKKNQKKVYEGIVKRHPDGFGFFVSKDSEIEDVYISKEDMQGVFSFDKVLMSLRGRSNNGKTRGKIEKVLERGTTQVVGRLNFNKFDYYLKDGSHSWGRDLEVTNDVGAEEGELVVVEITDFPDKRSDDFRGVVKASIGSQNDPNTDNMRILYESSVPVEFSEKALKEARAYGNEVKEADKTSQGRKDLRDVKLITIDGVTAKDFDDAIFVEETKSGFKLIVAIADVSHYVKVGTRLDSEAYEKGTSVYLSNYVCPMLPEELSNGLCSLNPNVDRLAFACEMHIDHEGEVKNFEFYEAVMNSHARVTYGEAQEIIDGGEVKEHKHVYEVIKSAETLAHVLNKKRMKEGSVDFDVPAVKVLVDDSGAPVELVMEERIFSNRLIEELMLITNISAAKFLANKGIPQLYRVHDEPDKEKLSSLKVILNSFLKISFGRVRSSHDFQEVSEKLQEIEDKQVRNIAQSFVLRSMKQAQYSSENVGHFGLGFSHYSHFTSPIRRYPDLVIHRQIKSALSGKYPRYAEEDVNQMGAILSAAEQRAVKAERKVTSIKKTRYMEKFLGEEFEGHVSSLTKFGVFVSLKNYPVDGLVKIDELYPDHYIYDEETWTLRGKKTGLTVRIGDKVIIQVANVNVEEGQIDFTLIDLKANNSVSVNGRDRAFVDKLDKLIPLGKDKEEYKKKSFKGDDKGGSKKKSHRKGPSKNKKSKSKSKKDGKLGFAASSSARGLSFGGGKKSNSGKKKKR